MTIHSVTGVMCCGNICFDLPVWPVDRIAWGTTTWVETIGESLGGNGANTSYALARLAVPVQLIGVVGSDIPGDKVLATLTAAGVDVTRIRRSDLPTTSTVAVVHPSGDRLFLHKVGSSTAVDLADLTFEAARGSNGALSHFHLANPFALPKVRQQIRETLVRAKNAALTTSLDTGWDASGRWMEDIGPGLPLVDLIFVNDKEAEMLSGHADPDLAVAFLRDAGATDIVVKLRNKGSIVFVGNARYHVPAFEVDVVDTTGAGDCYAGGFLAALHRGRSFESAARFANAVGALNVQKLGAAQGVLTFEEVEQWMNARSKL